MHGSSEAAGPGWWSECRVGCDCVCVCVCVWIVHNWRQQHKHKQQDLMLHSCPAGKTVHMGFLHESPVVVVLAKCCTESKMWCFHYLKTSDIMPRRAWVNFALTDLQSKVWRVICSTNMNPSILIFQTRSITQPLPCFVLEILNLFSLVFPWASRAAHSVIGSWAALKEYPTKASFIFFLSVRRFIWLNYTVKCLRSALAEDSAVT